MDEIDEIRAKKLESYWNDLKAPTVTLEKKMPSSPIEITDANFSDMVREYDLIVVDCWAPWCGPCRMLSPIIDELAGDYQKKVVFGKLNTDENRGVPARFSIMSIPTMLFIKNGQVVDTIIGAVPREVIEGKLKKHI